MKKILFILLLLTVAPGFAQETFRLETGDLLFQVNGRSAYTDAIKNVTSGIGQLEFSHVGVAYVENGPMCSKPCPTGSSKANWTSSSATPS